MYVLQARSRLLTFCARCRWPIYNTCAQHFFVLGLRRVLSIVPDCWHVAKRVPPLTERSIEHVR